MGSTIVCQNFVRLEPALGLISEFDEMLVESRV